METYAQSLELSFYLREQTIREAIRSLNLTPGSQGLDVGCGIGNITALLAEAITPNGHVTGVDISPEMVLLARETAEEANRTNQLSYRQGDILPVYAALMREADNLTRLSPYRGEGENKQESYLEPLHIAFLILGTPR